MPVTDENQPSPHYTHDVPPPCEEAVTVVYADDDLVVVNKPSGLLSVPGRFVKDCVLSRMLFDYPDVRIVHRLDLDTSGLLMLANSDVAVRDLNRQFRERHIGKTYEALVFGEVTMDSGEITLPIRPDPNNRPRQVVDHAQGKQALTRYKVMAREAGITRLTLHPVTGRSHQLRIHLAEIGHPILGCDLYAHEQAFKAASRLCLHARELAITHPATGDGISFQAPVPF